MVSKILFSTFRLGELTTLARQLYSIVDEAYPDEAALSLAMKAMKTAIDVADTSLADARGEALTDAIRQADSRRDDSYMGLRDSISAGLRRHRQPAFQQACERLKKVFDAHGVGLPRESYARESALLASLFKELGKSEAIADLATVGATEWLQELSDDEAEFQALYAQRDDDKALKEDLLPDAEAKQQLRQALEMMLTIINGLHLGGVLSNSAPVVDRLNQRIERATQQKRNRSRGSEAGSEEQGSADEGAQQ